MQVQRYVLHVVNSYSHVVYVASCPTFQETSGRNVLSRVSPVARLRSLQHSVGPNPFCVPDLDAHRQAGDSLSLYFPRVAAINTRAWDVGAAITHSLAREAIAAPAPPPPPLPYVYVGPAPPYVGPALPQPMALPGRRLPHRRPRLQHPHGARHASRSSPLRPVALR